MPVNVLSGNSVNKLTASGNSLLHQTIPGTFPLTAISVGDQAEPTTTSARRCAEMAGQRFCTSK
jgi:hypothetical protein